MAHPRCETCHLDFKNDTCFKKHLNTSRHIIRSSDSGFISIKCICGKLYSYHRSLHTHQKTCEQFITSNAQQSQSETAEMKETLNEMKAQIAMLIDKHSTSTTTTNNNHATSHNSIGTQQNITNININAFGNENTDYIDEKVILSCIDRVYKSIPSLLEKIHFDPKHPENHNIKITNKKQPYASIMGNNKKWKTVDRKNAIESMVQNGYNMLDDTYIENKEKFSTVKQQNFEGFQSKFEAEDKDLVRQLKSDVDMMVLNGAQR